MKMKINIIPSVCSVLLAGLAAWMFHAFGFSLLVTLVCGFTLLLSLLTAMGVNLESGRNNANIKVVAWIAVVSFAAVNLLAGLFKCGTTFVIIANVLILILMSLTIEKLYHAKM